jgi:hypothetical protein
MPINSARTLDQQFRFPSQPRIFRELTTSWGDEEKGASKALLRFALDEFTAHGRGFVIFNGIGGSFVQVGGNGFQCVCEFRVPRQRALWRVHVKKRHSSLKKSKIWIEQGLEYVRSDERLSLQQALKIVIAFSEGKQFPKGFSARNIWSQVFK